jgi:CheY-like chemotaxis protein
MAPRILIADDDADLIALHRWILARGGFELSVALNGLDALRLTREIHPHLVLTDYMMPGMNGLEVCRRIRSQPDLADVPVIILTASCERSLRQAAQLASATAYWEKPISPRKLLEGVQKILADNQPRVSSLCCPAKANNGFG